jgi:Leucine-rich repeat (LRR) protein
MDFKSILIFSLLIKIAFLSESKLTINKDKDGTDVCKIENVTSSSELIELLGKQESDKNRDIKLIECRNSKIDKIPSKLFKQFPNVSILIAGEIGIVELTGDEFKNADKLSLLLLPDNEVTKIGRNSFQYCKMLKTINLDRNRISEISDEAFNGLDYLVTVHLEANKLKRINENLFLTLKAPNPSIILKSNNIEEIVKSNKTEANFISIFHLNLENNKIMKIELNYLNIGNLELAQNKLEQYSFKGIIEIVNFQNNELKQLHISKTMKAVNARNNKITLLKIDNDAKLHDLDLSGNVELKIDELSELKNAKNLIHLNISNNFNADIMIEKLELKNLEELDITGNKISRIEEHESLSKTYPKLRTLHLLKGNKWNCKYLEMLLTSLKFQNIEIDSNDEKICEQNAESNVVSKIIIVVVVTALLAAVAFGLLTACKFKDRPLARNILGRLDRSNSQNNFVAFDNSAL